MKERSKYLYKIADKIEERLEELVELEVMNNGKIKAEASSTSATQQMPFAITQV